MKLLITHDGVIITSIIYERKPGGVYDDRSITGYILGN